jgi:hypothetical protein
LMLAICEKPCILPTEGLLNRLIHGRISFARVFYLFDLP